MATASDIAERALKRLLVQADAAALEASEVSDFIDAMNDFMAALEGDGTRLGYTTVSSSSDTVTIPDSCLRGLVANVAVDVAPDYNIQPAQALVKQAMDGLKVMRKVGRQKVTTQYPSNLPLGSGVYNQFSTTPFYSDGADFLLTISQETTAFAATQTAYAVDGLWKSEGSQNFRTDITGLAKFEGVENESLTFTVDLSGTGSDTYTVSLYQNGSSIATASQTLSGTPASFAITKVVTVKPGDEFQLFIENDTGTTSAVLSGSFKCR